MDSAKEKSDKHLEYYLALSFYFSVSLNDTKGKMKIDNEPFQEVSGLEGGLDTEDIVEGGENRFVHQLPKAPRARRLKLRRAMTYKDNPFTTWCNGFLGDFLDKPVNALDINIALLDSNTKHEPLINWNITRAYPIKWEAEGFDSMKNELSFEVIELAYHEIRRT